MRKKFVSRPIGYTLAAFGTIGAATLCAQLLSANPRPAQRDAFQQSQLSVADAGLLTTARERLTETCMRQHSYEYRPFLQNEFTDQLFPLAVTSPQWAREYGFGSGNSAALVDPNQQYFTSSGQPVPQQLYDQALYGSAAGPQLQVSVPGEGVVGESASGCFTYAQGRLYGNAGDWFGAHSLASLARLTVIGKVEQSRQFQSAVSAWRLCMARHGMNYPSPQAAEEDATTPDKVLEHARIAIAVAEAACATETPLARISATLFSQEVKKLPGLLQTALHVETYLELSAVQRATSIVSGNKA